MITVSVLLRKQFNTIFIFAPILVVAIVSHWISYKLHYFSMAYISYYYYYTDIGNSIMVSSQWIIENSLNKKKRIMKFEIVFYLFHISEVILCTYLHINMQVQEKQLYTVMSINYI